MLGRLIPLALAGAIGAEVAAACTPDAFADAARATGVPVALLHAVSRVESGGHPYALNIAGRAEYPDTLAAARAQLRDALAAGINPDVGCMQINTRWHPLPDPARYFDADMAASTAARLLRDAYERRGTWAAAVAEYHAGTHGPASSRGRLYASRISTALTGLVVKPPRRQKEGRAIRRSR